MGRPRKTTTQRDFTSPRVLAYTRVSTTEQGDSGAGLDAQRSAIEAELARRGWTSVTWVTEVASARDIGGRPLLSDALVQLDRGQADVLLAAKLDRLSRSVHDFTGLLRRAKDHGWALNALDIADTSTTQGETMAGIMAVFSQHERRIIGDRTRVALAAKRAQGVRLGRPPMDDTLTQRIVDMRAAGATMRAIADALTADGVLTPRDQARQARYEPVRGQAWSTSTVQGVLDSPRAAALAATVG